MRFCLVDDKLFLGAFSHFCFRSKLARRKQMYKTWHVLESRPIVNYCRLFNRWVVFHPRSLLNRTFERENPNFEE